jgi:hypothetical protein
MIDSSNHRTVVLPARGLLRGQRVGLADGRMAGPALLTVRAGGGVRRRAVVVHQVAEVPPDVLALGENLGDDLGLTDGAEWWLEPRQAVEATRIELELPTERSPEQVAAHIAKAGLLGMVLWVSGADPDPLLDIDDLPYRVTDVQTGEHGDVIARIGRRTTVELFAPGVKSGVDMVILADCSGSMDVDDIPVPRESVLALRHRGGYLPRMAALQKSLADLLDTRLKVAGRVSRIALLAFTTTTESKFPRGGGMTQLDAGSPAEVISQFREAVALLRPGGGTLIGNALHAAADLLYQHGHQGNERLIVLVSDGADWKPRGDQGIGEIMEATSEPIGLMEHLHRDMKIRLHAIGISDRDLFLSRYQHREGLTPNHDLLEELVKVGGGDPTKIGGLEVLEEYFSGLGGGITHPVRQSLSAPATERLDDVARDLLAAHRPGRSADPSDRNEALERLGVAFDKIGKEAQRVYAEKLFPHRGRILEELRTDVTAAKVVPSLRRILKLLDPGLPPDRRPDTVVVFVELRARLLDRFGAGAPDLAGLAADCRSPGTEPDQLTVALIRRVTEGLEDIAAEVGRLPPEPARAPAQRTPETEMSTGTPVPFVVRD